MFYSVAILQHKVGCWWLVTKYYRHQAAECFALKRSVAISPTETSAVMDRTAFWEIPLQVSDTVIDSVVITPPKPTASGCKNFAQQLLCDNSANTTIYVRYARYTGCQKIGLFSTFITSDAWLKCSAVIKIILHVVMFIYSLHKFSKPYTTLKISINKQEFQSV